MSWLPVGPNSLGVQFGNLVFLSKQIVTSNDGSVVEGSDVSAQAELIIDRMLEMLSDAEVSLDDAVSTIVYLRSLDDYETMNKIYSARFINPYPAQATVCGNFAGEGLLVEISAIEGRII